MATRHRDILHQVGRKPAAHREMGPETVLFPIAHRFTLWQRFVYAWRRALLRDDWDRVRNRAGGRPNLRLNARLKDGSDS